MSQPRRTVWPAGAIGVVAVAGDAVSVGFIINEGIFCCFFLWFPSEDLFRLWLLHIKDFPNIACHQKVRSGLIVKFSFSCYYL